MKAILLILGCALLCTAASLAADISFLAMENDHIFICEGDCTSRYNPGCDFSIALSVIGFDTGILENESAPSWDYCEGYESFLNVWKRPHVPRTWIVDSCVWYSGNLVAQIGLDIMEDYIHRFQYGNQDVTGMSQSDWPGALLISTREYVEFLQRFIEKKLFVSTKAYEMTEKILFIQDLPGSWELYGKTGVGEGEDTKKTGWFVGWIKKANRRIPFACCVVPNPDDIELPSFAARSYAFSKLFWLIQDLEK